MSYCPIIVNNPINKAFFSRTAIQNNLSHCCPIVPHICPTKDEKKKMVTHLLRYSNQMHPEHIL